MDQDIAGGSIVIHAKCPSGRSGCYRSDDPYW
jgi:hypothetical protein